jgi:hypothetical protein
MVNATGLTIQSWQPGFPCFVSKNQILLIFMEVATGRLTAKSTKPINEGRKEHFPGVYPLRTLRLSL